MKDLSIEKLKTQQFAKFYIKDLKIKNPKFKTVKSTMNELTFNSSL